MRKALRWSSGAFSLCALAALLSLLVLDARVRFRPGTLHQDAGGLALICIGASFVCAQLSAGLKLREVTKGVLLGLAFIFWGAEQFLSAGRLSTAMDSFVVACFVIDLALIVKANLGRPSPEGQ